MVFIISALARAFHSLMNIDYEEEYEIEENEEIEKLDEIRDTIILFIYWMFGSISFIFLIGFILKIGESILEHKIFSYFSLILSIVGCIAYSIFFLPALKEILYICFNNKKEEDE